MTFHTPPVIIAPKEDHLNTIIWLHGLGADGHDFEPVAASLKFLKTKFIFPHAPYRPISINHGMMMRGWYDIPDLSFDHRQDESGVRESATQIQKLIQQEISSGISSEHIFLAGFSQGGAIALFAGLTFNFKLGGIMALSTYLPIAEKLEKEKSEASLNTPILFCHGDSDSLLPAFLGENSCERLRHMGYQNIEWRSYPMDHSVCPEEILDIRDWLGQQGVK